MPAERSYDSSLEHLYDELDWLDLNIELSVRHARLARRTGSESYISDEAAKGLITDATRTRSLAAEDVELLDRISEKRASVTARVGASLEAGVALRLPHLASLFRLNQFEAHVIVICLASELDTKYERLYAYFQDDATRRAPGVDLVLNILCGAPDQRAAMRSAFLSSSRLFRVLAGPIHR